MEVLLREIEEYFNCKPKLVPCLQDDLNLLDYKYKEIKTNKFFFVLKEEEDYCLKIVFLNIFEDFEDKGLGKKIVNLIFSFARRNSYHKVTLISADNTIGFWSKCGFILTDKKRNMEYIIT